MRVDQLFEAIAIGKKEEDPKVKAMLDEWWKGTTPHPFDRRLRIWDDAIGLWLRGSGRDVELMTIMTFADKNQGEGSRALKWVCDLADKHGVELVLNVSPIKNAGSRTGKNLNKSELTKWYAKNGFVKDKEYDMRRNAKGSDAA